MTGSPPTVDLANLVARSGLGDRVAFADLYQATAAKLFAVLLRIVKNEEMAEDALQDVYIKVWHNAGEYHAGKGAVMTWLISIARYRAIDMLRRGRTQSQTVSEQDHPFDLQASTDADPAEMSCRLADDAHLSACLQELDLPRRACLVLAYCEGYTHDELAARLGSPVGTVKSWIRRGLQVLKACLKRADPGLGRG